MERCELQQLVQYLQRLGDSRAAWAPAACPLALDWTPSYDSAAGERREKNKNKYVNESTV